MYIEDILYNFIITAREYTVTGLALIGAAYLLAQGLKLHKKLEG